MLFDRDTGANIKKQSFFRYRQISKNELLKEYYVYRGSSTSNPTHPHPRIYVPKR